MHASFLVTLAKIHLFSCLCSDHQSPSTSDAHRFSPRRLDRYLLIMPTVLQVYSNHQSNSLLCRTVEFICKQFYVLHRKPFVLQMLGSIAPMLDLNTDLPFADANKVRTPSGAVKFMQCGIYS